MNRWREDLPYTFRPPMYSRFWAPFLCWLSDVFFFRKQYRVASVESVSGIDRLLELFRNGDSLLITPNHSDHCDPHTLIHIARKYRIPLHFMAAREVFEKKNGIHGSILQRAGVFSIDREGTDLKAVKEAIGVLAEGRFPLVMFPEGEIYHLHEKLTPLNEGAANIALRVARRFLKDGGRRRMWIVPTGMTYRYTEDISGTFDARMAQLEAHILWAPQDDLPIIQRIYKFGEAALALKEKEFLNHTQEGDLGMRLHMLREAVVSSEEERYFGEIAEGGHPIRIRRVRGKIRSLILGGAKPEPMQLKRYYRSLDRLYFAIQLYSYPGQYILQHPSMDRIDETLHKFEEDVLGTNTIAGDRSVRVAFCEPIDVSSLASSDEKHTQQTVGDLTHRAEQAIRAVVENVHEKPDAHAGRS